MRVPSNVAAINAALGGLVALNRQLLRAGRCGPLYQSGVRYRRDRGETWDACTIVQRRGWGDCEDLASWRAAELQNSGIDARAVVVRSRTPGVAWHCVVRLPSGKIEDPSARLGMHGAG